MKIAFLASAKSGLGHLRRIANIAAALRSRRDAEIILFCNAPADALGNTARTSFLKIEICEKGQMSAAANASGVDLAVSDMAVVPGLADAGKKRVLILRETPRSRISSLALDGGRPWDRVILPNPAGEWWPDLPSGFARSVEAAGWISRRAGARTPDERSEGIVVATGGGGTEATRGALYPLLDRVILSAKKRVGRPIVVRQALGPRAKGAALGTADCVFDPGSDLQCVFRRADLVVSTAGYNSVLEMASTDTPVLLAAIPRSFDDQLARVRKWAPRLGYGLEPGNEAAAADWLADRILNPRRRAPVALGADGAARAAELLLQMA